VPRGWHHLLLQQQSPQTGQCQHLQQALPAAAAAASTSAVGALWHLQLCCCCRQCFECRVVVSRCMF
jgi:hypothetical protein